jgi:hypothetical protein
MKVKKPFNLEDPAIIDWGIRTQSRLLRRLFCFGLIVAGFGLLSPLVLGHYDLIGLTSMGIFISFSIWCYWKYLIKNRVKLMKRYREDFPERFIRHREGEPSKHGPNDLNT